MATIGALAEPNHEINTTTPQANDHHHPQASPGPTGRDASTSTTDLQETCTTTAAPQMKLTIPTDQQLGHQIESIVRIIAIAVAFVYAAGFTFGQSIHWLSANLTQLHTYLLKPTDGYAHPHPVVIDPDVDHRSSVASSHRTRAKGFAS